MTAPVRGRALESAWYAGAKITPLVTGGQVWRLVIAPLNHVELSHFLVNLGVIGVMAGFCVGLLGNRATLAIFFLGAWGSTGASAWLNPEAWSIGASGGGYALTGALIGRLAMMSPQWGRRAQVGLGIAAGLIGLQISMGGAGADRVAHLAGVALGLGVGLWAHARRGRGTDWGRFSRHVFWPLCLSGAVLIGWAEWRQYGLTLAFGDVPRDSASPAEGTPCDWARPVGWVSDRAAGGPARSACLTNGFARVCLLVGDDLTSLERAWFGGGVCLDHERDPRHLVEPTAWRLHRRSLTPGGSELRSLWTRPGVPFAFAETHLVEYEIDPRALPGLYAIRDSVDCGGSP